MTARRRIRAAPECSKQTEQADAQETRNQVTGMAQRVSGFDRIHDDIYETPRWVVRAIAPFLAKVSLHPWDPFNGPNSKLVRALKDERFKAIGTNSNFFATQEVPDADAICTNPAYGVQGRLARQFIEHALTLPVDHVFALLRNDFDSGITRTHLFRDCRAFAGKIVLLGRAKWFEGPAEPSDNHAWFHWSQQHRGSPTIRYSATFAKSERET